MGSAWDYPGARWRRLRPAHALLLIAVIAAGLRCFQLGSWPLFSDEDGYTAASIEMLQMPWPEAALYVARPPSSKPPLAFVLQGRLSHLTGDPVVAGRILSAISGTITAVLCFFLGRRLGGSMVGIVSAFLYAVSPVAVLHERMVLQDGPMAACALGAAVTGWAAIERRSWLLGGVAALLGAAAVQFKISAVATAVVPVLLLVAGGGPMAGRVGPAILALGGPLASYAGLMWSPLGPGLLQQNRERLVEPFSLLRLNLEILGDAAFTYFPAGLVFLIPVGAALALWRAPRPGVVVASAIVLWSSPWLVLSDFVPSRYFLPAVPYACALIALALVALPRVASSRGRAAAALLAAAAVAGVATSGIASVQLVANHRTAAMPRLDDWQYRSGWPSGYGYAEALEFVSATADRGSAVAYVVHPAHRTTVRLHRLRADLSSFDPVEPGEPLPRSSRRPLYVLVDDGLDRAGGRRTAEVLAREPRLRSLARFVRPGSDTGVSVLRTS